MHVIQKCVKMCQTFHNCHMHKLGNVIVCGKIRNKWIFTKYEMYAVLVCLHITGIPDTLCLSSLRYSAGVVAYYDH